MAATPKKKRKHLPRLNPDKLKLIAQAVEQSPRLSKAGKRAVMRSLEAAANPDAESPEVVIATLPKERQETVIAHVKAFMDFGQSISSRGRRKLAALSDSEWQRLFESEDAP